jgi:glycine/D-amino acid oxidase-like deaminating enzyme
LTERAYHVAIVGGGLVGAALGYGMRDLGKRLAILDEGDIAYRAARGNFGLIWVQGKGLGMPSYGAWTQRSAAAWPAFAADLAQATGIDVALRQHGGLHVCVTQQELERARSADDGIARATGLPALRIDILDRAACGRGSASRRCRRRHVVRAGRRVQSAALLRALRAGVRQRAAHCCRTWRRSHRYARARFVLHTRAGGRVRSRRAGSGSRQCALGAHGRARGAGIAEQGHILVTERLPRFLDVPIETVRQTDEGTVLIGDAQQEAGFDTSLDTAVMSAMAGRAAQIFPALRGVRVVRAWSALRVMSPDGFPVCAQSREMPGAWIVTCHSAVTLAAAHACVLAPAIRGGSLPSECAAFDASRFHVLAAA